MSRDSGVPSYERKPQPNQQRGAGAVGAAVAAAAPAPRPPAQKPQRPLQQVGFQGGIQDFNNRLQQAHDAHLQAKGFAPPPGLALDVARSPVPIEQIPKLFQFGGSTVAKAAQSLGGIDRTLVENPQQQFLKDYQAAKIQGEAAKSQFLNDHADQLREYQRDPKFQKQFAQAFLRGEKGYVETQHAQFIPSSLSGIMDEATKGVGQVTQALVVGPPTLAWEEGKATYHDVGAVVHGNVPTHLAKTNVAIARGAVSGIKQDFEHPGARPGFLFLDVFGLASAGAGTVTRLSLAGKALARGEAGAAVRGLVERPRGGRIALQKGEHIEQRLGSENMLVNAVQRITNSAKNAQMARRSAGEPSAFLSIIWPQRLRDRLEKAYEPLRMVKSPEAKMRRESEARYRVEHDTAMVLKNDLHKVAGWDLSNTRAWDHLPTPMRRGLTVGEQKALQVITLDDTDPLTAWRNFHLRMIQQGIGDEAAHRAHLSALNLAEKVLNNPSKRFKKAVNLYYETIAEQERLKMEELGLSPDFAEKRVIAAGQVVRSGQHVGESAPKAYVSPGHEGRGSLPDEARERGYLYHRAPSERLASIKESGLVPAKPAGDNPAGVYFANDPLLANALAWKHKNSVYLRVKKSLVPSLTERAFGESLTTGAVPANSLEYLGEDGKWHPASNEMPVARRSTKSTYAPFFSKLNSPRKPSERGPYFQARQSQYGLSLPRDMTELHHQFTGESLMLGDFRLDATTLAGDSYGRAVRLASVRRQHKDIWDMATPRKMNPTDRPVRDVKGVPDKLKEMLMKIEGGDLTGKEVNGLTPTDVDGLIKFLYPERLGPGEIDNVRWFDPALIHVDHAPMPSAFKYALGVPNELIRVPTLFLRLAYELNAIGNGGMAILHQGIHTPPNLIRGIFAKDFYGERVSHLLDALGGETHTKSFTDNRLKLASTGLARAWSVVADNYFRRGAIIHELRRLGHDLPIGKLNAAERKNLEKILSLKDEATKADVIEAGRRGNKAMVEFNNMTWAEREIIKHFIFVYPWVSRSLVWSIRSIVEHPMKADLLAQVGNEMDQEHPELYSKVPAWFAQTGYIPVGFDKNGNPKVVNATSVNSFTTLSQLYNTVQAGFSGSPSSQYNQAYDMLGPTAHFLVRGLTGKDEYGNLYPDGAWLGAAREVVLGLPQIGAYQRGGKVGNKPLSPLDITKRDALVHRLNEQMKQTVFSPGWADGYGMLVSGGLTWRTANEQVLYAKYWSNATPTQRHGYEVKLIHKAFQLQAGLLKTKVPAAVSDALDMSLEMSWQHQQMTKKLGRTPTELERTQSDITLLADHNRIPEADAKKLLTKAKGLTDPTDLRNLHSAILGKYAGANDLQQWGSDVRYVASYTKPILEARLASLGPLAQIKKVNASQETLYEAGRQALAFRKNLKERSAALQQLPSADRDVAMAELRAWEDAQDKPIKAGGGGVILPSPVRLAWAEASQKDRTNEARSLASRSWGSMTNFQKEIVGKKVPAKVSAAWAEISKLKAEYKQQNFTSPSADQMLAVVKQLEQRGYTGILQDYLFSQKPAILRFEVLRPYREMPADAKKTFDQLAGAAKQFVSAMKSGKYPTSELRQTWTTYVNETIKPWLAEPDKAALRSWLEPYGPNFLASLVGK